MNAAARERGFGAARELAGRAGVARMGGVDVEALAAALGARVVRGRLEGAQARLVANGRRAVIRLNERVSHPGAQRFSIAHELGHLVMAHGAPILAELCAGSIGVGQVSGEIETEANAFAAELLMPEESVRRRIAHWRPELSLAHAIAEECGVSPLAATVRMVELSIDRCAAVLVENGRVAWAARSASFGVAIERGRRVDARALAFQCQERAGCDVFGRVPAAVWIGSDAGERSWMFEQATRIPDLRAVLTLVWAPDHGNRRA